MTNWEPEREEKRWTRRRHHASRNDTKVHNKGEEGAKFRHNKVGIKWAGVTDKIPEMCHLEVWDERSGSERA